MKRKGILPVVAVSGILLVYCILILTHSAISVAYSIFVASPFLLIWVVYSVVCKGIYAGKELDPDEEWGYADKRKDEPGVF